MRLWRCAISAGYEQQDDPQEMTISAPRGEGFSRRSAGTATGRSPRMTVKISFSHPLRRHRPAPACPANRHDSVRSEIFGISKRPRRNQPAGLGLLPGHEGGRERRAEVSPRPETPPWSAILRRPGAISRCALTEDLFVINIKEGMLRTFPCSPMDGKGDLGAGQNGHRLVVMLCRAIRRARDWSG